MSPDSGPSLFDQPGWDEGDLGETASDDVLASTWSVGELHRAVEVILGEAFGGEIWVEGEIRNLKRSANRHVYFDLVDSGTADEQYPAMLSVTLFSRERQIVNRFLSENGGNIRMGDGLRVRIRGRLNTYASRSSLQLRMSAIDPTFTLGVLDLMREQVLAALAAEQLLDRNGALALSPVPSRIALITSVGSAAHADALDELTSSGLGLQVSVLDARVQGLEAEQSLLSALTTASQLPVDAILLVRGGGARTDLAAFDLESVARAIATATVPVVTGIGHEVDTSIADRVAHTSHKTPTAAAAMLVRAVRLALDRVEIDWADIVNSSTSVLAGLDRVLTHAGTGLSRGAARHIGHEHQHVEHLWRRAALAAPRAATVRRDSLDDRARRVSRAAGHLVELSQGRLDALAARSRAHDPKLALARGWSITRTASGRLLRSLDDVRAGDTIESVLADGVIQSVVQSTAPDESTET